jgi:hypothetical protein
MKNKSMSAVVRWVLKDQAEPVIGICVPMYEFPGDGKRIDYMFWAKVSDALSSALRCWLMAAAVCGRRAPILVPVTHKHQD